MDSIITTFLLFIGAIVALLSYLIIPRVPVVALITGAAIALAAGVWWHWTQFSVDYRTSTWQEQLRYYGSFVMVLTVILLSYAFYALGMTSGSISPVSIPSLNFKTATSPIEEEEEEEEVSYTQPSAVMPNLAPKNEEEEGGMLSTVMSNLNILQ
jgi:hypothetical protein